MPTRRVPSVTVSIRDGAYRRGAPGPHAAVPAGAGARPPTPPTAPGVTQERQPRAAPWCAWPARPRPHGCCRTPALASPGRKRGRAESSPRNVAVSKRSYHHAQASLPRPLAPAPLDPALCARPLLPSGAPAGPDGARARTDSFEAARTGRWGQGEGGEGPGNGGLAGPAGALQRRDGDAWPVGAWKQCRYGQGPRAVTRSTLLHTHPPLSLSLSLPPSLPRMAPIGWSPGSDKPALGGADI